jgi:type I restriction enzyme S subunit
MIRTAVEERENYAAHLKAGRNVLESVNEIREAEAMCAGRKGQIAIWSGQLPTLSAWNYASVGGALEYLSRRWPGRLGDILEPRGLFRGDRAVRMECEAPFGVRFVSQRDAFLIRGGERRVRLDGSRTAWVTPAGTTLLAAQGSDAEGNLFGRAAFVTRDDDDRVFSEHLMRVIATPEWRLVVYGFLSTEVGFRLIRSTAVGTAQRSMREDLLARLPIPELPDAVVNKLRHHLSTAFEARERAEHAEAKAIATVEREVVPAWLA